MKVSFTWKRLFTLRVYGCHGTGGAGRHGHIVRKGVSGGRSTGSGIVGRGGQGQARLTEEFPDCDAPCLYPLLKKRYGYCKFFTADRQGRRMFHLLFHGRQQTCVNVEV